MSLGKDSITKRVAKPAEQAPVPAPQKKAPAKKPSTVKAATIAKVAPETVERVVGHKENTSFEKFMLGEDLPTHLL